MAHRGTGFFNRRGQFFKRPEEATLSDIAALLGKIGEGDGLAMGIAHILLERRSEIERILADHDEMLAVREFETDANVTSLADIRNGVAH